MFKARLTDQISIIKIDGAIKDDNSELNYNQIQYATTKFEKKIHTFSQFVSYEAYPTVIVHESKLTSTLMDNWRKGYKLISIFLHINL